ncbi:4Fe-4S ferredoxin N-terminal domain-containing protein [Natrarchaeobius chitinivorans]|uniref:4Fe-4S dicluster domain-containing protein n=1 Tax=Natrarchaeobius chitinivorans TaxID=1679083 RepID=A0A3N6MJB4_NATCH|nr:4Fe-4S ferredoxin N-terminal domain-containing protein [Natrarchaeobius chitinivorans]RQG95881.1 4Fe-4S dicluster domain-containing protein [Natrarchaeobius chitinivorans]
MSADDESFHPLGGEWEDELETMLDDTEYDSDLGMEMAKDAMRVTKGELSEAEFHEMYHDDVMEEFGEDNRPTEEAYEEMKAAEEGTFSRMLSKFEGDGEDSRRGAMKKMGAGAAAVGLGAWGTVDDGEPEAAVADTQQQVDEQDGTQWGMTIDLERCDGCLTCVTACQQENQTDQGVNWMYVLAFEDDTTAGGNPTPDVRGGNDDFNFLVRPCQHCTDAPCEKVCPTTARHTRDKDGLVLTDYDVCIGCRYCQVACPYGVNYFQWEEPQEATEAEIADQMGVEPGEEGDHMTDERGRWVDSRAPRGVMSKCTFCPTRQDGLMGDDRVGTTACEDACPPDAIQFGDVNDERSDAYQHGEYPSKSRAIIDIVRNIPSPDAIDNLLSEDDDLESALEAFDEDEDDDLDQELVSIMKAIEIVSGGEEPAEETNDTILEQEQAVLESLEALEQYVDLESEDVLAELQLGDGSEDDANLRLRQYAGIAGSKFKLLEDIGTNPNITYIGQNPGPNAEQVESWISYEDVGQTDNRKEILDEGTVGDPGVSL